MERHAKTSPTTAVGLRGRKQEKKLETSYAYHALDVQSAFEQWSTAIPDDSQLRLAHELQSNWCHFAATGKILIGLCYCM